MFSNNLSGSLNTCSVEAMTRFFSTENLTTQTRFIMWFVRLHSTIGASPAIAPWRSCTGEHRKPWPSITRVASSATVPADTQLLTLLCSLSGLFVMHPPQRSAAAANPEPSPASIISLFFIICVVSSLKGPNFPLPVFLDEGDEEGEEGVINRAGEIIKRFVAVDVCLTECSDSGHVRAHGIP